MIPLLLQPAVAYSVFVLAYLASDVWRLNRLGPSFALQELRVDPSGGHADAIFMRGRPSGVLGWVHTLLGLEADATLRVSQVDLRIEHHSLQGFRRFYVPLHELSSSSAGYFRAVSLMVFCVSSLAQAYLQLIRAWTTTDIYERQSALAVAGGAAMVAAIVAAAAYLLFELSKRFTIAIETSGGVTKGIAFKRSVIENVTVGLPHALSAVDVLNDLILRRTALDGAPSAENMRDTDVE